MGVVLPLEPVAPSLEKKFDDQCETTDLALFVRTSAEDITGWNRQRIVDALLRETFIDPDTAVRISRDVEKTVKSGALKTVTGPLIRELVNARLLELGLEQNRRMHTRLGVPLYDVDQLLVHQNKENANIPHGPEATNLTLAEGIKKEYALLHVFTEDVADAHRDGRIHLHDLGYPTRVYCSSHSLEYLKKYKSLTGNLEHLSFKCHRLGLNCCVIDWKIDQRYLCSKLTLTPDCLTLGNNASNGYFPRPPK